MLKLKNVIARAERTVAETRADRNKIERAISKQLEERMYSALVTGLSSRDGGLVFEFSFTIAVLEEPQKWNDRKKYVTDDAYVANSLDKPTLMEMFAEFREQFNESGYGFQVTAKPVPGDLVGEDEWKADTTVYGFYCVIGTRTQAEDVLVPAPGSEPQTEPEIRQPQPPVEVDEDEQDDVPFDIFDE